MTDESADGSNDDLLADSERYYARREVAWLTALGFVLILVAGFGTWLSRWETVEFREVDVIDDRVISVGYECNTASRFESRAFDDRVEIVLTQRPPENNQDCYNARCVQLSEPLDGRSIINGGTGDESAVRTIGAATGPAATQPTGFRTGNDDPLGQVGEPWPMRR